MGLRKKRKKKKVERRIGRFCTYDLAGRAKVRSSFRRSFYDGDVGGKGKFGTEIATSSLA